MGDTLTAGVFWSTGVNSHSPVSCRLLEGGAGAWLCRGQLLCSLVLLDGCLERVPRALGNSRHWEGP